MGYFRPQSKQMRPNKQKKLDEKRLKKLLTPEQFEVAREEYVQAEAMKKYLNSWKKFRAVGMAALRDNRVSEDRANTILDAMESAMAKYLDKEQ